MDLPELESIAAKCTLCELNTGRIKPVFARGSHDSRIIVCGMCPGRDENNAGSPFVGKAGKILDSVLVEAFGDSSSSNIDVYITNLVKCFVPPGTPLQENWMSSCLPYFISQIGLIRPKVIIALGRDVSNFLLSNDWIMKNLRGKVFEYMGGKVKLISTYHPSYLARGGGTKHFAYPKVVEDFRISLKYTGG